MKDVEWMVKGVGYGVESVGCRVRGVVCMVWRGVSGVGCGSEG